MKSNQLSLLELFAIVALASVFCFCGKWMLESQREIQNWNIVFPWELKK